MIRRAGQGFRFLCIILTMTLLLSLIPTRVFADAEIRYYSVEEGHSFEIQSTVVSSWDKHINLNLEIRNTGDKRIDNWHLTFNTPYIIENIWNASVIDTDDNGTYTKKIMYITRI